MKIHPHDTALEEVLFLLDSKRHGSLPYAIARTRCPSLAGMTTARNSAALRHAPIRPAVDPVAEPAWLDFRHADYGEAITRSEAIYLQRAHGLQVERAEAPTLVADLIALMPEKRRLVVVNSPRFQTWGVYELLLERSWALRGVNRIQAEELARLALDLSSHLDTAYYKSELIEDLRARAWTFIANLRRITGDYLGSEDAFQKAYSHLRMGTREPLERAMYLDLRASLRSSQRRYADAMAYLSRAVTIFLHQGDTHRAGKSLVNLANIYSFTEDDQKAFATLEQALPLIDPAQDERLLLCARHNQIDYLTVVGRFPEARALYHRTLPLYVKYNDLEYANRRLWIRGRIARGFGETAAAEQLFRSAQTGFVNAGNSHEAALVSLELAVLLAEQKRASELKTLAVEMIAIFSSQHIHQEALAAVLFLKQATDFERLNLETALAVSKFARRALVDPTVKFEASSVSLN